ncbi:magnesium transporter [Campylobacter geochelonis]|uniref:Magnesium transporter MgtE n=1 Tax=Campylobacter geochelonis TaxID=1780362 RepID=A0A128EKH3_9BACT|nr:magnesium transporter [Campylobacter geochelonis]QKF71610.1 magnesium/cobalt/nickel transporter, MgtE family [Campylobacter geochelonis]CZE48680.1 magnesium transporter [Campylobacter geochelonis]CZE48723.1 magnesium transporter [Campylobacter geochelonis]CZE51271.1 magnesium transporter [Campylobacter geochelonis]
MPKNESNSKTNDENDIQKKELHEDFLEAKELLDSHINETSEDELSGVDITEHLKTLKKHDEDEYTSYLEKLDAESLADAAIEMPEHMLKDVLENVPKEKLVEAMEELESDDQVELLEYIDDIDEVKAREIFDELDDDDKEDILKLSNYDEDEAGAYMQIELFKANLDETVKEAVDRLRSLRHTGELESVYQLFAVDKKGVLKYSIPLADLIIYNFSLTIDEVVRSAKEDEFRPKFAQDSEHIDDVVTKFEKFDLSVLPVVDSRGVLVGRITTDDIHDIIQERATEQIYNLAGVDDEAEEEDTLFKAGKARAIWLLLNLFTALIASFIIGFFDKTIETIVALAILMPIVSGMSGNAGTQALTVTVRRLALGEIEFNDKKGVLKKEIGIVLVNGLVFACLLGIVAYIWFDIAMLGVVIACAMFISIMFAGFLGTVIPLTLKKLNIDPAVGSSVLLTALTDIIGFFSFLGLATWILL